MSGAASCPLDAGLALGAAEADGSRCCNIRARSKSPTDRGRADPSSGLRPSAAAEPNISASPRWSEDADCALSPPAERSDESGQRSNSSAGGCCSGSSRAAISARTSLQNDAAPLHAHASAARAALSIVLR
jgi:hypothetical protein